LSEKLQVVQLTFEHGAKVAEVARAHGLNANQVFTWRRAYPRGELSEQCAALLPVSISSPSESEVRVAEPAPHSYQATGGSIRIEIPGRALISVESGADLILLRSILESLRK
jgi:transposase